MLSKTSIVICGMLLQGEMNAYDMLKMIESMNMQYWHPIGATTLYESCLRLEKKGFIEDTGKAENKAVYRLTAGGREELKSTICALFERVDFDSVWFCLAVMYSEVLTKEELEEEKKKKNERHFLMSTKKELLKTVTKCLPQKFLTSTSAQSTG